jgi:hypothetical protein
MSIARNTRILQACHYCLQQASGPLPTNHLALRRLAPDGHLPMICTHMGKIGIDSMLIVPF